MEPPHSSATRRLDEAIAELRAHLAAPDLPERLVATLHGWLKADWVEWSEHGGAERIDRRATQELARAIERTLYAKDPLTGHHVRAVGLYARQMARALDLSAERQEFIYVAGLLHDVGKLGIPDDILKKAGPLDEEEWRFMKRHPEIAAGMISELSGLSEWREPLLYHHERWDGTGYPTGMAGAGVPFEARIISVCDSYDAMTRRRTYSAPRPHAEAIGELLRCAGTQFDPALVEVFVALDLPDPDSLDLSAAFP